MNNKKKMHIWVKGTNYACLLGKCCRLWAH